MLRIVFVVLIFASDYAAAQVKPVQFEQLHTLQRQNEKLVMVLVETDWCKYCQALKHMILNDKRISGVLDTAYYTVFLNAESKYPINFAGRRFVYKPAGVDTGVHELAEQLGSINGQLSFPSLCFLNSRHEIVYQYAGFLDAETLYKVLNTLTGG